jgi:hypothetical protein
VQSTDGDFLPLALVHCEANSGRHVFLERIETKLSAGVKHRRIGHSSFRFINKYVKSNGRLSLGLVPHRRLFLVHDQLFLEKRHFALGRAHTLLQVDL